MGGAEGLLERAGIAPQAGGVEADVLVPPPHHHRAQAVAEEVEALSEGVAALLQIQLGPEQAEQGIAAMEAVRRSGGEIGQQCEPLGLRQNRPGPLIGAVGTPDVYRAKRPDSHEPGHCGFCAQGVTCRVTARGRSGDGGRATLPDDRVGAHAGARNPADFSVRGQP